MVITMGVNALIGESMLAYLIKTIKELLTSKKKIGIFAAAFLLVGALALTASGNEEKPVKETPNINIGVVDNDNSVYSSLILNYFKNTESVTNFANITLDSEEKMKKLFNEGKLLAYLVIPPDFANSLMGTDYVAIDVVMNTSNLMYSVLLKNMLDSYGTYITNVQLVCGGLYHLGRDQGMSSEKSNQMNIDTSIELVKLALNKDRFFDKIEVTSIPSTPVLQYYLWAVLALLIILTATLSGGQFLKERQLGTYERLRIAGHSVRSIVLMILIVNSVLWIICFNLLLPVIVQIVQLNVSSELYLYVSLCILLANACFLLVSIFCRSNQQYSILCTFGLMLISVIGGVLIPISFLPERFLVYSRMTPTYHMIRELISFVKGNNSTNLIAFALATLLVVIAIYVISCYILFKQRETRRGEIG